MFPGVSVLASAAAAATLDAEKAIAFFRQIDAALTAALLKAGAIADQPPPAAAAAENRIAVDRVVGEGDVIAVDDIAWTVLETPGHSDCSISLHDAARGLLVISDATRLLPAGPQSWWPNYFSRLRGLPALPSSGWRPRCRSALPEPQRRRSPAARMSGRTSPARSPPRGSTTSGSWPSRRPASPSRQFAEELGGEIHRQAPLLPLDFFQKNCGLLIKQSLRYEGKGE